MEIARGPIIDRSIVFASLENEVFMNKRIARVIGTIFALVFGSIAAAECTATGCWDVYVEELYPEATGGIWIRTSGSETLANCTPDSGVYLRLTNAQAGYREIFSTLLAAQLADKKVSIRINPGSNPCSVAYVTLNRNSW
jgi:hypothetical protein